MTEDQLLQFQAQGFLHLPGVIAGAMLSRLQAAFEAAARRSLEAGFQVIEYLRAFLIGRSGVP